MVDASLKENDYLHLLELTFSADMECRYHIELIVRSAARKVLSLGRARQFSFYIFISRIFPPFSLNIIATSGVGILLCI